MLVDELLKAEGSEVYEREDVADLECNSYLVEYISLSALTLHHTLSHVESPDFKPQAKLTISFQRLRSSSIPF